jgi:excisionase family DNA binding protein
MKSAERNELKVPMDPKRVYTLAEIAEALNLRGSLQDQIAELTQQVASMSAQIAELKRNPVPIPLADRGHQGSGSRVGEKFLYSRREAAQMLSICLSSLEQLIARGELKTRRMGKRIFIPRGELVRLAGRDVLEMWPERQGGKTVRG